MAVQIETLLGSSLPRPSRWGDLRRHLYFGHRIDLPDIVKHDWPDAKAGLSDGLYDTDEPIPVEVDDLGSLAEENPTGKIATNLKWDSLTSEDFERVVLELVRSSRGYENPEWLMRTNAPDGGRDISVYRVISDPLAGVERKRVIIQCKHWLSKSVSVSDVSELKEQMKLWEPPRVDVLVIATSGRFTQDAVREIESHKSDDRALSIEMWPDSRLEQALAEHPAVIGQFKLR